MAKGRKQKLLSLQLRQADIARRNAMIGMARAIDSETRHRKIMERSRSLMKDLNHNQGDRLAIDLRVRRAFANGLNTMARDSDLSARQAGEEAMARAKDLARAEERHRILSQRRDETEHQIRRRDAQSHAATDNGLARKLHR